MDHTSRAASPHACRPRRSSSTGCSTTSPPSTTCGPSMPPPARPSGITSPSSHRFPNRCSTPPPAAASRSARQGLRRHAGRALHRARPERGARNWSASSPIRRPSTAPSFRHHLNSPAMCCSAAPPAATNRSRGKICAVNADTGKTRRGPSTSSRRPRQLAGRQLRHGWRQLGVDAGRLTMRNPTPSSSALSNAAPDFYGADRKGRWQQSHAILLALDPKTGKLKWHRQEIPRRLGFRLRLRGLVVKKDGKDVIVHLNKSGRVRHGQG